MQYAISKLYYYNSLIMSSQNEHALLRHGLVILIVLCTNRHNIILCFLTLNPALPRKAHFVLLRIFSAHGYSDDISTYGLVSGLWTSMSALGYFIGPSIGGIAVDLSGFQWASLIIIGGQIILVITSAAELQLNPLVQELN